TDWLNPKGKPVKHLTPRYEPKKGSEEESQLIIYSLALRISSIHGLTQQLSTYF
ncbi:hypothetical protein CCACVL1_00005, partial [Corchorus capsularis]